MPDNNKRVLEIVRKALENQSKQGFLTWKGVLIAVLSIIYVLSPVDLIPDIIPVIGQCDDGAVVLFDLFCLFRAFRNRNSN